MHVCNVCYKLEAYIVSSYNDLKVDLTYKIKIQRFIIIVRYIAAIKVKKKKSTSSTLSLMCGPSVQKAVRRL